MLHVCHPGVPACSLDEPYSWDKLLGVVDVLCLRFKQPRGAWAISLGAAAARLQDGRTLLVEQSEEGTLVVTSPARVYSVNTKGRCTVSCGACYVCLKAEQVMPLAVDKPSAYWCSAGSAKHI